MIPARSVIRPPSGIAIALAAFFLPGAAHAQSDPSIPPPPPPREELRIPDPYIPPGPLPSPEPVERFAPEPASARFGAKGQFVLGGASSIGVSSTTYDSSQASLLSVTFSPNLDYFVLRNFSLGLDVDVAYSDQVGYASDGTVVEDKTSTVALGPRLGWNIPLGPSFSWWLTGTIGFESEQTNQSLPNGPTTSTSVGASTTSRNGPYVSASLPLLFHPSSHLFFGLGPYMFHEFGATQGDGSAGEQRTSFGGTFVVGGYWGGTPDPVPAPAAPTAPPETGTRQHRFGDQGEALFTNELSLQAGASNYAGTPTTSSSGQILVGFDYFVVDHVSIGAGFSGSFSSSSSPDASGNPVTDSNTSYGGFLRFGVHIPLAGSFSLYPRGTIGIQAGNESETTSAGQNSLSFSEPWVSAYVPLVLEVAPHFVVGVGPSISRDVSETSTYANGQQSSNPATTLGAGVLVGGWL